MQPGHPLSRPLSGDGRADITARDKAGVLWLYKGTGDYKAPFAGRTKIGGGWNVYDRLLSLGDSDADGKVDLLARKTTGELLRYSGTGNAARPFTDRFPSSRVRRYE
ncbi:FG-GAP repeat domain-containing protein [Streptomyces sp. NPDC058659]|uniref:FG-GAP repeat domain-containing protein n=1 Tax=unclassified Streptomyces TaxID=2593676 RepID=UPI0036591DB3